MRLTQLARPMQVRELECREKLDPELIMRDPAPAAALIAVVAATLASLGGSGPAGAVDEPPKKPPPAATRPVSSNPPLPAVKDDAPPPEGVLRAYVWDCDGGLTLHMKNLLRDDAITLEMHEGPRKLPRVMAASGAKYSDGSLTFWTKGRTAILQRADSAPVNCRELPAASLIADARERGVRYRGTGNEPGWVVEIGPGSRLLYAGDYGHDRREFDGMTEREGSPAGAMIFEAGEAPQRIAVDVTRTPCVDDMSGARSDFRMDVEVGGKHLRGCATAIR